MPHMEVTVLLGLCNPPRRGHGEPAKPGVGRVGSIVDDLESWVMCYDRHD
jgi:hypothetical protein